MSTDYENFYKENPHGLGEPFSEFVEFFDSYKKRNASVLDLGCGQGRDALFIARMGHSVVGVDISKTGIEQLLIEANNENLDIQGIVEDIREYKPAHAFDVVVIDRTLHMLREESDRIAMLKNLLEYVVKDGYILIADEKKNLPAMHDLFERAEWKTILNQKGFLFVQHP